MAKGYSKIFANSILLTRTKMGFHPCHLLFTSASITYLLLEQLAAKQIVKNASATLLAGAARDVRSGPRAARTARTAPAAALLQAFHTARASSHALLDRVPRLLLLDRANSDAFILLLVV